MIFRKQVPLYVSFTQFAEDAYSNDVMLTSRDTNQTGKQANNGDKEYMLL